MPIMDGYEATKKIRSLERENKDKKTPIIALSAYAYEEEIKKSLAAGFDNHLTKPIDKKSLKATISKYVKGVTK